MPCILDPRRLTYNKSLKKRNILIQSFNYNLFSYTIDTCIKKTIQAKQDLHTLF